MSFAALGLPEPILRGVRAAGYAEPTPIQREAIPLILPGHDLIAAAQTGSGKTAAFLLPILSRLLRGTPALRALVLVPTRELAAQIEASARGYARFASVRVGVVFGGVPIAPQERMLRHQGVDLLVATPGRLLDLHGRQSLSLDDLEVLVLDEADRMVDMGFAPDLKRILRLMPRDRQTLMFSATMPREVNAVAREATDDPRRLELSPPSRPAPAIVQRLYPVPSHLKLDLLVNLLSDADPLRAIVFMRTKRSADRLASRMKARGHHAALIHGDRKQGQRERALLDFKRGRAEVLIATDIASRGIDVDHVTHVVNFDVPRAPEDYVHRIGRTGRMEAHGEAITLFSPEEREQIADIERFLGRKVERVTVPDFDYGRRKEVHTGERGHRGSPATGRSGRTRTRSTSEWATEVKRSGLPSLAPAAVVAAVAAAEPSHGRRRKIKVQDRRSRRRM
jgi:ATP-dependent RNA helicase RhlE